MSSFGSAMIAAAEQNLRLEPNRQIRAKELAFARTKRVRRRARALQLFGGKCEECGSTAALHFHHMNFNGKEHRAAAGFNNAYHWVLRVGVEEARKELVLLCKPCHQSVHSSN